MGFGHSEPAEDPLAHQMGEGRVRVCVRPSLEPHPFRPRLYRIISLMPEMVEP